MNSSMEDDIEVLIENYDIFTNSYKLGHQYIGSFSIDKLKSILLEIPVDESQSLYPVQIITNKYIFNKLNEDDYICEANQRL